MKRITIFLAILLIQANASELVKLGDEFMKLRNWVIALRYFEQAIEVDKDLAYAWYGKGLCLCQLGRYDEGLSALDRALFFEPKNKDYLYVKGVCLEWKGKDFYPEAELYYKKVAELAPQNSQIHNKLGTLYMQMGMFREAVEELQKAISLAPDYFPPYNNLGNCYLRMNKCREAIRLYQNAIKRCSNPREYHFYNNLGIAYLACGEMDKAKSAFLIETALSPDYVQAHLSLANIYFLEKNFDRAREEYFEVLAINPDNPQANLNLAIMYIAINQPKSALLHLQKYVELKPESGEGHYLLGKCYSLLGDKERAWKEYLKSLKLGYRPTPLKK